MDNLFFSLNAVVPIFVLVFLGWWFRRINLINDTFIQVGNNLVFYAALPCNLFLSIYRTNIAETFNIKLILFAIAAVVLSLFLLYFTVPHFIREKTKSAAVLHGIFRSNTTLLGIPLATNMFGLDGIAPTSLTLAFTIPLSNILAVVILSMMLPQEDGSAGTFSRIAWRPTLLNIVKHPLIIASALGIAFSLLQIKLPDIAAKSVTDLSSMAIPLALICLGGQFKFHSAMKNIRYTIPATAAKLILLPLIFLTLAALLGIRGYDLGAVFVLFASPTAVSAFVLAKKMGADPDITSDIILFTTFFSMFTMILGIYILRVFQLL